MSRVIKGVIFVVALPGLFFCFNAAADTIFMKDGKEVKGVVVEEYADRLVVSTVYGETGVIKAEIEKIFYDEKDINLMALAEKAKNAGDYKAAASYYEKALKINPKSTAARDGLAYAQGVRGRLYKQVGTRDRQANRFAGGAVVNPAGEDEDISDLRRQLAESVGITMRPGDRFPAVVNVKNGSPAFTAGLKPGDLLVAIWGKLTGYRSFKDVMVLLLRSGYETRCVIERTVAVPVSSDRSLFSCQSLIGASFEMTIEGFTVRDVAAGCPAEKAGLAKDDLITSLGGEPTRYMPLKEAVRAIKSTKGDSVVLTIRRSVIIWKKEGG